MSLLHGDVSVVSELKPPKVTVM